MSNLNQRIAALSVEQRKLLARQMAEVRKSAASPPSIHPIPREGNHVPLSFVQRRYWFMEQFAPGSPIYTVSGAARVIGSVRRLDIQEQCFSEVIRRHEILRTTFTVVDGQPVGVIAPVQPVVLRVIDLRHESRSEQEEKVHQLGTQEIGSPFDLAHGPLFRLAVVLLTDEEYMVVMTMHHIIFDGWSSKVFFQEMGMLYQAFLAGAPSLLPELPFQYADFVQWQQQFLQGEILDSLLAYWKRRLSGELPVLALPTDHPRPAMQTFRGARHPLALSPMLTHRLKELSRSQGSTLFMTLLAAFKTLLHRYTGQDDMLVGIPIANRTYGGTEALLGAFVNTLVLRADLSGDPSFLKLLEQVHDVALEAYSHQDLPFEKLVEELHPERDLSHSPLFQVLFNFQHDPTEATQIPGLTLIDIPSGTAEFELSLSLIVNKGGIAGYFEYNCDLFDSDTIRRLAGHFQTLLEGIATDPNQRLSNLPLLTGAELQQALVEWNQTQAPSPVEQGLHQLIAAQARRTPDCIALSFHDEQLSYTELDQRASRLASQLQHCGIGPESLIAILAERSIPLIVGILAVFKAGGAYIPLDPSLPPQRISQVLADAQPHLLLTTQELAAHLPPTGSTSLLWLESIADSVSFPFPSCQGGTIDRQQLAYVIYTSGSTGQPKGVMISQQGMLNHLYAKIEDLRLQPQDCVAQNASPGFDISVWQMWAVLLQGGRVHLLSSEEAQLPHQLWLRLREQAITVLQLVPSILRLLLDELEGERAKGRDPQVHLRVLLATGEALPPDLCHRWLRQQPGMPIVNAYGPTECSDDVTHAWLEADSTFFPERVPIGRPLRNTQLYVLDRWMKVVPAGVVGELYVGGEGVGRGYLGAARQTSVSFVPNPWSREPGARLYRTGDLVRYWGDGQLEYLKRADEQVKLRGYRIELEEIEAVLDQHPFVREAVVLVREGVLDGKLLEAYIIPVGTSSSDGSDHRSIVRDLKRFLKEKLPDYMVPSNFVLLDAFPLTLNGKINRKALLTMQVVRLGSDRAENYAEPSTELERTLIKIWKQVLGIEHLGIHDSFFDVGGHSLLATQLMFRLRDILQVEIPLYLFFQTPTIAGMAGSIELFLDQGLAGVTDAGTSLDLAAEAVLDPAIQPDQALPLNYGTGPQQILVTGITGFLGAFLLDELFHQSDAQVYCLVRAATIESARERIRQNLADYGLWDEAFTSRIIPVIGDLAEPLIGLASEEFHRLANIIDIIYHNGALVNFLYPYEALKAANVVGTQEVLRLASSVKVKPVHYVSTISVFSLAEYAVGDVLREQDNPKHGLTHTIGYSQSKWVSEQLVMEAGARGLPISIYRPGTISGHSQTGIFQLNDFTWQALRVGIRIGVAPDVDMELDMVPVDFVGKAIMHLSRQEASLGKKFHLVNPYPIHMSRLVSWMKEFGYKVDLVPYEEWCALVRERAEHLPDNTARGLTPLLSGALPIDQLPRVQFDYQNTKDGLAGTSIACPPVDSAMLTTYFSHSIQSGYFDAPPLAENRESDRLSSKGI